MCECQRKSLPLRVRSKFSTTNINPKSRSLPYAIMLLWKYIRADRKAFGPPTGGDLPCYFYREVKYSEKWKNMSTVIEIGVAGFQVG